MMLYSLLFYPWKFLWPVDLSPMYELPARVEPLAWRFLLPMVAVPVITAVLIALRRRWPGGLAAWVYSALLVLPVSGAVHAGYQLAHDRYSYLSGLGLALLVGGAVVWVMGAGARRVLRPWLEGLVLATVALLVVGLRRGRGGRAGCGTTPRPSGAGRRVPIPRARSAPTTSDRL